MKNKRLGVKKLSNNHINKKILNRFVHCMYLDLINLRKSGMGRCDYVREVHFTKGRSIGFSSWI